MQLVSNCVLMKTTLSTQVVDKLPERQSWETPAKIVKDPGQHGHFVTAGNQFKVGCEAEAGENGEGAVDIAWTKNGQPLAQGNELVVTNVNKDDIATYACNATSPYG